MPDTNTKNVKSAIAAFIVDVITDFKRDFFKMKV